MSQNNNKAQLQGTWVQPVQVSQEIVAAGPNEVSTPGTLSGIQVEFRTLSVDNMETGNQEVVRSDAVNF